MDAGRSAGEVDETDAAVGHPLPASVDWVAAVIVAVGGLALTVGGSALTFVADRDLLRTGIESGEITVVVFQRDLTEAEMLAFALDVVTWTGIGLILTGIGLVLFAVGYILARRRARQRAGEDGDAGSALTDAVLGAVATTVLSFLPFSPVVGGAATGYLEHGRGGDPVRMGALSGLLAVLPGLVVLLFVTVGVFAGLAAIQATGLGIVATAAILLVLLFIAASGAGLGALGGYAGDRVAERWA